MGVAFCFANSEASGDFIVKSKRRQVETCQFVAEKDQPYQKASFISQYQ